MVQSFARFTSMDKTTGHSFIDYSRIELQQYKTEITENKTMLSLIKISLINSLESLLN